MRLATIRRTIDGAATTVAARVNEVFDEATGTGRATVIAEAESVDKLLADPGWRTRAEAADGERIGFTGTDLAPVCPAPSKIFCVGLNYAHHITEMGHELPTHPTLFGKFAGTLTGPFDDVTVPAALLGQLDFEGELALIVGTPTRDADADAAADAIAGYAIADDYTDRDLQYRTLQWLAGKNLEASTGLGPWLTTADEWAPGPRLETFVDGARMQSAPTDDLVFPPAELVSYISRFTTLNPGDVILTGTPDGVAHARGPEFYLTDGQVVEVAIGGLGRIGNRTRIA